MLPLLGCAAVCLAAAPNTVTAPSVSLEGKNLWILQSRPVDGKKILFAKLKLHMVITAPIAFLCGVVLNILLKPSPVTAVLTLILPCVFIFLCGELGLLLNLKMPKLDWTNEAVTVKQSMSVMISLFANWGIIMLLAGVYYLLPEQFDFKRSVSADLYCCFSRLLGCPVEDADRLGRKADAAFAIRQKEEIVKVQRFVEPSEKDKPQYGQF